MSGTLPVAAQPSPPMEEDDELDDDEEWEYYSEEDELGIVPFVTSLLCVLWYFHSRFSTISIPYAVC